MPNFEILFIWNAHILNIAIATSVYRRGIKIYPKCKLIQQFKCTELNIVHSAAFKGVLSIMLNIEIRMCATNGTDISWSTALCMVDASTMHSSLASRPLL